MRFPNLKNILRLRPSVFKFNLKWTVIFLLRKFSCLHPQQAGQAGTNSQFLNQILQIRIQKRLLGFSQTRHSAQNCAVTVCKNAKDDCAETSSMIAQKCTPNQRNKSNLEDSHLIRTTDAQKPVSISKSTATLCGG